MKTLNLGILAHVDAGKTSLTERLLHEAGVIDEVGSVDEGSTQTDSLEMERRRGITIKAAVVSFEIDDVTVNLIDTPGHPDFIAEVERALAVLDGAVLVISAVEGVQAQTRVLMRALRRLRIPTLIFVNKIDRGGAQYDTLIGAIAEKLSRSVVAMGSVTGIGTREAAYVPFGPGDREHTHRLVDVLAEVDESLLAEYVADEAAVSGRRLHDELVAQTGNACVHPIFFGSAITGAGVPEILAGIRDLLPSAEGDAEGPLSGTVFKIERGPAGDKIAYVRLFSGTLLTRDRLALRGDQEGKVTSIAVFGGGSATQRPALTAGHIGKLWGLADVRIGDPIGLPPKSGADHHFSPPTLETVIVPCRAADKGMLHAALSQLAEQDPLINVRRDDLRQETFVSLYGEVQKEVIQDTLSRDFGVAVEFHETTTICVERPAGSGAAAELLGKPPNPFLATVGLRVDPAPVDAGIDFRLEVELGSMPYAFIKAVEETVRETLNQGLYGWQVLDCTVTMTHSGYLARQSHSGGTFDKSMSSTAGDFRHLTPLVLMAALRRAGTRVYEPIHRFRLEIPADVLGIMLPVLARLQGVPEIPLVVGSTCTLEGVVPAARVYELQQQLPGLTRGEGVLESAFDSYEPVRGTPPTRARWDRNPLNRNEYLIRVLKRN